ncbi:hypothetical protein OSSY52_20240 [Tepiditoga spiralis]|uniref:Uncharacterized protein n=1 Tax=Tepiditoga spiralis TaxID=2108365 RepID=A0A7G1GA13_9BACT|nr:hypothetical protein [Tepiditoga spiralis]BBE31883.1 hypothetical protein OSSY52_20240 [Tepiditoga spiralis]
MKKDYKDKILIFILKPKNLTFILMIIIILVIALTGKNLKPNLTAREASILSRDEVTLMQDKNNHENLIKKLENSMTSQRNVERYSAKYIQTLKEYRNILIYIKKEKFKGFLEDISAEIEETDIKLINFFKLNISYLMDGYNYYTSEQKNILLKEIAISSQDENILKFLYKKLSWKEKGEFLIYLKFYNKEVKELKEDFLLKAKNNIQDNLYESFKNILSGD